MPIKKDKAVGAREIGNRDSKNHTESGLSLIRLVSLVPVTLPLNLFLLVDRPRAFFFFVLFGRTNRRTTRDMNNSAAPHTKMAAGKASTVAL